MIIRKNLLQPAAILFFLLCLSGCASFKGNNLATIQSLESTNSGTSGVDSTFEFKGVQDYASRGDMPEISRSLLKDEFVKVLNQSGSFARLAPGQGGSMHLDVTIVNSASPVGLLPAILTGLSLYLIPSWATDNYEATVVVSGENIEQREYKFKDDVTLVQWLPMIFVGPFTGVFSVAADVRLNMWKHLVQEMREDGLIPTQKQASKQQIPVLSLSTAHP